MTLRTGKGQSVSLLYQRPEKLTFQRAAVGERDCAPAPMRRTPSTGHGQGPLVLHLLDQGAECDGLPRSDGADG